VAAINLLEKREVQVILSSLSIQSQTAKDLNKIVVLDKGLCSTATLYRRLSELQMASIIIKVEDEYQFTAFGKSLYQEFLDKASLLMDNKRQKVLQILKKRAELSTTQLISAASISPNDLIEILHDLEAENMVNQELSSSKSSKGGRPRKLYSLSQRGQKSTEEYEKLRDKVKKK
jgi:DNA-binding HxlR family transcriptional regulator